MNSQTTQPDPKKLTLPPPKPSAKSEGKISKLPLDAREWIADQLQAGATHQQIIDALVEAGFPKISSQNITNWKKFGYQRLLEARQRQAERDADQKEALELAQKQNGGQPEASLHFAIKQVNRILTRFDTDALQNKMPEDSALYFALLRNLTWLNKAQQGWTRLNKPKNPTHPAFGPELGLTDEEGELLKYRSGMLPMDWPVNNQCQA